MIEKIKITYYLSGALVTSAVMTMGGTSALAQEAGAGAGAGGGDAGVSAGTSGGNDFSSIAGNIVGSISSLPGLLSAFSYLAGTLFGVLGILKIKDHVENPSNAPLQQGAVRLAAGGALFALPIIFEAMFNTIGSEGQTTRAANLNSVTLGLQN